MPLRAHEYVVVSKRQESPSTATLSIAAANGTVPAYRTAQLITVYFADLDPTLGKPYSISSAPIENALTITVKAMGRFSNRLCSLEPGEALAASLPYDGGLSSPLLRRRVIMLAAGMGVAPFRGQLIEAAARGEERRFSLLQSAKQVDELLFAAELAELAARTDSIELQHFITQHTEAAHSGRMQTDHVLAALDDADAELLLCGPLSFVLEQKAALINASVNPTVIRTEAHS